MTKDEALNLAIEALEEINKLSIGENAICLPAEIDTAMDAIKEALAQPEPAKPEALRLADAMEYDLDWCDEAAAELRRMHDLLGKANALCRIRAEEIERLKAQPEQEYYAVNAVHKGQQCYVKAQPEQSTECGEPVAFPRQAGKSIWTVDTAFIWRVKHTIDPDTPNDFTPSEEQIETVLLALEKIPSKLYTTPPQRKPLTDEELFKLWDEDVSCDMPDTFTQFKHTARAIEAAHGIKGEA